MYLKTSNMSTPVTTATQVAESQPGRALSGASKIPPNALAKRFNQTRACTIIASLEITQAS